MLLFYTEIILSNDVSFISFFLLTQRYVVQMWLACVYLFLILLVCLAHLVSHVDMWLRIFGEMDEEGSGIEKYTESPVTSRSISGKDMCD